MEGMPGTVAADGGLPAGAHALDNPIWRSLAGPLARFRVTDGIVKRFDPEVAPFAGAETDSGLAHLGDAVPIGDSAVLFTTAPVPLPAGFEAIITRPLLQMVAETLLPVAPTTPFRPLGAADVPAMMELVELTKPGPFAPRTFELGGYVGLFEGERLVGMAGERMHPAGFAEVSAVCTHPDVRGRGIARQLVSAVAGTIAARGDVPFLHVFPDNAPAVATYEAVGFTPRRMMHVSFLRRVAAA